MQHLTEHFFTKLAHSNAILVRVQATQGSVPREAGAWMAVFSDSTVATVGGGRLELDAIAHARALLHMPSLSRLESYSLGPRLGQCCGGHVTLTFTPVSAQDHASLALELRPTHFPVALFGSGHVGRAIVRVLGLLPVDLTWVDSRDQPFAPDLPDLPDGVYCEHSDPVQGAVAHLVPQSRVLVMSFSHAEDLAIVEACLRRQRVQGDLPFLGLIGSKTKWVTFRHRLKAKGFSEAELARVTCPIGIAGIHDKRPEVIAAAVAAQLLLLAS